MRALLNEPEVLDAFRRELNEATEACMALALVSTTGLKLLKDQIVGMLERDGTMRILIGVDLPTDPSAIDQLRKLARRFKGRVDVKRFQSGEQRIFHTKLAVFVRPGGGKRAILGSSNLTSGGLKANFEANLFVDDAACAQRLADHFDELFEGARARGITEGWLESYRRLWREAKSLRQAQRRFRGKIRRMRKGSRGRAVPERIHEIKFAFTGGIADWPREPDLYPLVEKYGGRIARKANAMAKADFLVHGDILGGRTSTQKLRAARRQNIPVITEEEFFAAVQNEKRRRSD